MHVIHNGIDTDAVPAGRRPDSVAAERIGVDPDATLRSIFVGRITRQKGVNAPAGAPPRHFDPGHPARCFCAGAPDTPEIEAETAAAVERMSSQTRTGVIWVREMLPRPDVIWRNC